MTHIRRRLRTVLRREKGSMPLALMIIIFVTGLVAVTTLLSVTKIHKTQDTRDFALAQQAADAAVNDALMWGNSGRPVNPGRWGNLTRTPTIISNNGDVSGVRWSWSLPIAAMGTDTFTLQVTAANPDGSIERDFDVDLTRTLVQGADTSAGKPVYRVADSTGSGFAAGFFGAEQVTLGTNTIADSYNATGAVTGNGRIATNQTATLATGADVDRLTLYNATALPYRDRCVGPECGQTPTRLDPVNFAVPDITAARVTEKCAGRTLRPWIASIDSTLSNNGCYASLTFDRATTVSGATTVYVTGDVNVAKDVTVNGGGAAPNAGLLRLYTGGSHVTLDGGSGRVAWALWAPNADCAGGTQGKATIYGSMLCKRLATGNGWALHFDDRLTALPVAGAEVWTVSRFVER